MKIKLAFLLLIVAILPAFSQVDSVRLNSRYLKHYYTDTRDLVISPVKWKGNNWLKMAAFAGTTVALIAVDEPVKDFFQQNKTHFLTQVSKYGLEPFGHKYALATVGSFVLFGEIFNNSRSRSTGYLAAESFVVASLLVRVPKVVFGRSRPDAWPPSTPGDFKGPFNGTSFPSGHTTAVFSVASVIAYQYKSTVWVPVVAYSIAGMTGLSRIYDNRHWASDVFAAAILGTVTGQFICKKSQQEQFSLMPANFGGISGVTLQFKW